MSSIKTLSLNPPDLSPQNLISKISYQRAFRQGGPRLEQQIIKDKTIYHNYGHGAAAWSHAFGSAYLITKSIPITLGNTRNLDVAVLGSGFLGVMNALQLAKRNYTVTIYSQRIPQLGSNALNPIASEVDFGKWFPFLCDQGADPLRHEVLSKLSFDYYKDCIDNKKYQSIATCNCYDNHINVDTLKQIAPTFIVGDYHPCKVNVGRKQEDYVEFNSLSIDSPFFLQQIIVQAKLRGIKFIQKKFQNLDDILALKQSTIVNCLGMGAAKIFNDKKVKPITAYQLVYKNPQKCNYMLSTKFQGQEFSCIGLKDKFIVGNYTMQPKSQQQQFNSLQTKSRLYFNPSAKL